MPTVEIDGRRIEVEDGATVIQAAERLGIEIPHYCWHPGLSVSGNCRMCLVEIEKTPKLQIACSTQQLQARLPGYLVPRLVRDVAGGPGKLALI